MKTLVAFYSRTGNTRHVAEEIAKKLGADLDEIKDQKKRKGLLGFITGARDAFTKKQTEISHSKDPKNYELVIVGTPVWAATMVPAVRSYLTNNTIRRIACFCTYGGSEARCLSDMQKLCKKPMAVFSCKNKDTTSIKSFTDKLTTSQ